MNSLPLNVESFLHLNKVYLLFVSYIFILIYCNVIGFFFREHDFIFNPFPFQQLINQSLGFLHVNFYFHYPNVTFSSTVTLQFISVPLLEYSVLFISTFISISSLAVSFSSLSTSCFQHQFPQVYVLVQLLLKTQSTCCLKNEYILQSKLFFQKYYLYLTLVYHIFLLLKFQ